MKRTLTKLLVCLLIMLILSNHCMVNVAHANVLEAFTKGMNTAWGVVVEFIEDILGTVVGIFAIIPKMIVLPLALSAQSFMASIAYSQGVSDADGNIKNSTILNTDTWFLTPFDIIFNKVALVDVNIFNIPTTPGAIKSIREAAASWYYVMRNIAAGILLCVLIYVGIRMAISTVASDKAAYKKMLVDWACSLALIFLLQYIIVFTFAVNTGFLKALEHVADDEGISTAILKLYASSLFLDIDSIAATIVICMLTWQTISLLISYISRMLKVTFLVIISPLITLTYSIDKMGDGKAQALNAWLKEFVYTVLLQPFHCIIYTVFVGIAMSILTGSGGFALPFMQYDNNNIGAAVLCVICIHFVKEAEKILGKIFNFSDAAKDSGLGVGMVATAALAKNAKNIGKGARNIANGAKNMSGHIRTAKIEGMALGTMLSKKNRNSDTPMTYQQAKEEATAKVDASADAKLNKKAEKLYEKHKASYTEDDKKNIQKLAKEIKKNNAGMTSQEAMRRARIQTSRKKMENGDYKSKPIRKVRGFVSAINQTETAQLLKKTIPSMISMGTGIFVGAGSFGVGGDALNSILLGTSTSSATKEYFSRSTRTLTNNSVDLLKGAGITDQKSAKERMGQIAGRSDEFEGAAKKLDELYNNIAQALNGLNSKDRNQVKGSIRNIIDQALLKDPSATNQDIMDKINNNETVRAALKDSKMDRRVFSDNVGDVIDFQRDAGIYQNMKNAADWGLNPGVLMDDTVRHFPTEAMPSDDTTKKPKDGKETEPPKETPKEIKDEIETIYEREEVAKTFEDLSPEVQQQIKDEIQKCVDTYIREINDGKSREEARASAIVEISDEGNTALKQQLFDMGIDLVNAKKTNDDLKEEVKKERRKRT